MCQVRWQELTRSECFRLLAAHHLGRVVLIDELGPAAFPVNYVLDGHTVLFRTDEGRNWTPRLRGGASGIPDRRGRRIHPHRLECAGAGRGR